MCGAVLIDKKKLVLAPGVPLPLAKLTHKLPEPPVLGDTRFAKWERLKDYWKPSNLIGIKIDGFFEKGNLFVPPEDRVAELAWFHPYNTVLFVTVPAYGPILPVHHRALRLVTKEGLERDVANLFGLEVKVA